MLIHLKSFTNNSLIASKYLTDTLKSISKRASGVELHEEACSDSLLDRQNRLHKTQNFNSFGRPQGRKDKFRELNCVNLQFAMKAI